MKGIDTNKAPREVQLGLGKLIAEVAANLEARRTGGDTNAANERLVAVARELQSQFDRHRGNPC